MDIVLGAGIGAVQVAIGHPFDTVKTLLQNGQSVRNLKLKHFYRGWTWPIMASVGFNAVAFPIYHMSKKNIENNYVSGFISGLVVAPIEYGFGVAKIRQQTLTTIPWHGKGFTMATLRTSIAMSVYFGIYEDLKNDIGPFYAGAMSGLTNWTLTYPFDTISARQIASKISIRQAISHGKIMRGYVPCAIRALLVNSVSFKIYDMFY